MTTRQKMGLNLAFGLLAGLVGSLALVALWHLFGGASTLGESGYAYTGYLSSCCSWRFAAAYFALNVVLGSMVRPGWPVALGMMLPFPIAFGIEISLSPTSHNLIPFEVLLYWLPTFGLALLGGYLGKFIAVRLSRKANA